MEAFNPTPFVAPAYTRIFSESLQEGYINRLRSTSLPSEKEIEMKKKQYFLFLALIMAAIWISSCGNAAVNPDKVWHVYDNQQHGYSFNYPPDCTYGPLPTDCKSKPPEERRTACLCFLNTEDPDRVLLQKFQSDGNQLVLAEFSIALLKIPIDKPLDEIMLSAWLAEKFPEKWQDTEPENIELGGNPAVSFSIPASNMAPMVQEIYFIHHDRLFQISLLEADKEPNSQLYERILTSFHFDE